MADFNIQEMIEQVVEKLTGNKNLLANFKKDPIAAVKSILGKIDLDNDVLEKIVAAVKGKIDLDAITEKAGGIGNILGKLKGLLGKKFPAGTDRLIMRGLFSSELCPIDLPLNHILGSDETLVGSNQGEEDGLDYTFSKDEKLVLGGEFLMKTLKENKVYIIQREIAKQPVLSFGNSSGDFAMDNYALSNPNYKSLAFQLCCDDLERENGNTEKADKMLKE